ncbi:hypothetical protein BDA99DRAFT_324259 [Phascolomyces articulosus]|uniref:RRM domain-containing protein n=1 Tax=Phascolomyces articulosus TaxID=60185 RepID=A0AAD5PGB6_9FUNG|nr:hypothetical protein BDA99DRAFT_324259 [Phascolomyces articulosus]
MTIRGLANKGITIKGAAAAASTSTISGTTKEQSRGSSSPMQKRTGGILDRISSPKQQQELSQPKSILDRISSPSKTNATVSHLNGGGGKKKPSSPAMDQQNRSSPLNRIGRQRGEASPTPPPSSTSGKATTLLIKNLSDSTTEADIRQFGQAIPGGITHVALDKQQAKVTLKNPESAVLFRRKYNRTALKGSHIVISFS